MVRLLLPILLLLLGTGGGVAAAMFLSPADHAAGAEEGAESTALDGVPPCGPGEAATVDHAAAEGHAAPAGTDGEGEAAAGEGREYFKINNQFVVPLVSTGRVASLVVASLELEITAGTQTQVFEREPRLRDALLQVMFDHANLGGFDGVFTTQSNMRALRSALRTEAQGVLGTIVHDVLITDIVRQDTGS